MKTKLMAFVLLKAMQADATKYLVPDNECEADWFVNRMLLHLDGPEQRLAQEALEADISRVVEPVAHLKFWAYQQVSVGGDVNADEGLEVCRPDEIGIDGQPAFPVYAAPQEAAAPEPVNAELLSALQGLVAKEDSAWIDAGFTNKQIKSMPYLKASRAAIAKAGGST